MTFVLKKLRSISRKQAVLIVVAALIAGLFAGAAVLSNWALAAMAAAVAMLYLSVLTIIVLRQIEFRLGPVDSPGVGAVSAARKTPGHAKGRPTLSQRHVWGAVGYYAELNARKSKYLGKQLVRSRYVDGRDVLAHVISQGRLDMAQLRDLLDAYRAPVKRKAVVSQTLKFNGDALREMARVLYRQDLGVTDRLDAIACYGLLFDTHGARAFSTHDVDWLLGSLLAIEDLEGFHEWVGRFGLAAEGSVNFPFLMANAVNPWSLGPRGDLDQWNQRMAGVYSMSGVPPAQLRSGEGPATGHLGAGHKGVVGGPQVSVIVPVYNPGPEAEWALMSLAHQSWKNLEIIVVDDGSTEGLDVLARLPSLDHRISVTTLPRNQGAYSARNAGLQVARGELVTCHDADDWAHPMRIELQAQALLASGDAVANISSLCRVDRDLVFKNRNSISNPDFVYPAFATLMFRRLPVLEKLGGWDRVRKAADSEFISRLGLVFNQEISVVEPRIPLTFALLDGASLSGSELFRGYLHPERRLYQTRYKEWHEAIADGTASPTLAHYGPRAFAAPAAFLPEVVRPAYDVVFVSELGFTGGNANSLLHEIRICLGAGFKVAIARARNLLFVGIVAEREPIEPIKELIRSGAIDEITLTTRCDADLVIVRWPACFQYLPQLDFGIKGGKAIVVANHVPYETGNVRHFYDIQRVLANVKKAFGVDALWAPQSAVIRALCAPHLTPTQLLGFDWVGVLENSAVELAERTRPVSTIPTIGRHSRDDHLKWPETRAALLDAYPLEEGFKVRVMGGVDKLLAQGLVTREELSGWELLEFNELAPPDFLKTIDFFVYFPHRDLVEAFGRVVMEALASGAVVVVPAHFEPIFGDACVYVTPAEVKQTVTALHEDWSAYLAQSRRGQDYIRDNCTPAAYVRRLARLGVVPRDEQGGG